MPSVREQMKNWIRANKQEKDMTAETLERLYDVMLEMETVVDNTKETKAVPVEKVEKWFQFLQFAIVKELTGKNEVVFLKEEEVKDAIEKRFIKEGDKSERPGNDG